MRISKPCGVAVSPHNIQRRRTTASHPIRASQTVSQAGTPYGRSTTANTTSSQRPMSWHPGSRLHQEPTTVPLSTESKLGNTIAEFETLAVSGPIPPVFEEPVTMGHISTPSGDVFDQLATGYSSWDYLPIDPNAPYPSYGNLNMSSANQYYIPTQYDCFHGQAGYQTTEYMDAHSISQVYQTPTAMEMLPIQYAAHTTSDIGLGYPPKIATKKSRELVGMGLYDDKNGSMDSPVDAMGAQSRNIYTDPNRSSMGKGLKLEETWQPPGSGSTEEAEDYSSDEAEEDLPVAPPSQQTQPQVFSDYKDLSNQSFFFESDDQYSNYLAMEQAMQFCKPKAPDPSSGNFLWL